MYDWELWPYLCQKNFEEMEKLEMLLMYHSRTRIGVEQMVSNLLDYQAENNLY